MENRPHAQELQFPWEIHDWSLGDRKQIGESEGKRVLAFDLKHRSQLPLQVKAFIKKPNALHSSSLSFTGRQVKSSSRTPVTHAIKFLTYLRNIARCRIALVKWYFSQFENKRSSFLGPYPSHCHQLLIQRHIKPKLLLSPSLYCSLHGRLVNWEASCWGKE